MRSGRPDRALEVVDALLAVDPGFLAARALRDIITTSTLQPRPSSETAAGPHAAGVAEAPTQKPAIEAPPIREPQRPTADLTAASIGGIERRARQRRLDRCLTSMRAAMAAGELEQARVRLDEARELEARNAGIALASAELKLHESREASRRTRHGGASAAIGLWLAAMVLGGAWIASQRPLHRPFAGVTAVASRPGPRRASSPVEVPRPIVPPSPSSTLRAEGAKPTDRAGRAREARVIAEARTAESRVPAPRQTASRPADPRAVPTRSSTPRPSLAPSSVDSARTAALPLNVPPTRPAQAAPAPPVHAPTAPAAEAAPAPASANPPATVTAERIEPPRENDRRPPDIPQADFARFASIPAAAAPRPDDDERLVRQVLYKYEAAYEALDAQSAKGIWPGVNVGALARAFASLSAQELQFDTCGVDIRGVAAVATCRGVLRYVPKVGRQEPKVDARVWTFALEKRGPEWRIASARAAGR